jgi:GTP cyclohydrolase I
MLPLPYRAFRRRETDAMDEGAPLPAPAETARVSERIRARIRAAGRRFHANDNIAEFLQPGDREQLLEEVEARFHDVLESLVIDTRGDHNTEDTARRVAKMYLNEVFRGRYEAPPAVTEFPNAERLNELTIVGPMTVRSACSHHFCPIMGRLWIGLMPNEHSNLIGLSKYARLAEWILARPQIQEEAIAQIADLMMRKVKPDGLAVVMEADHFCMHWRGIRDSGAKMVNSVMRGSMLKDPALRREFLSLLDPPRR